MCNKTISLDSLRSGVKNAGLEMVIGWCSDRVFVSTLRRDGSVRNTEHFDPVTPGGNEYQIGDSEIGKLIVNHMDAL